MDTNDDKNKSIKNTKQTKESHTQTEKTVLSNTTSPPMLNAQISQTSQQKGEPTQNDDHQDELDKYRKEVFRHVREIHRQRDEMTRQLSVKQEEVKMLQKRP